MVDLRLLVSWNIGGASGTPGQLQSTLIMADYLSSKDRKAKQVVEGLSRHLKSHQPCELQKLGDLRIWKKLGSGLGKLKTFLQKHNFSVDERTLVVQLAPTSSPPQSMAVQVKARPQPPAQSPDAQTVPQLAGLKTVPRPLGGADRARDSVVSLKSLSQVPESGSLIWVDPSELRWTHNKLQRLFTCGRALSEVAHQLRSGRLVPSDLPRITIVFHSGKWYSRNNRRLWCLKTAAIQRVEVEVGVVDQHFLNGFTTTTDGLTVEFWPPCRCSACGQEFPNLKGVQTHLCVTHHTSALDWDDNASEASSESSEASEDGAYGEDGLWYSETEWSSYFQRPSFWMNDEWGRSPLWRAAATGCWASEWCLFSSLVRSVFLSSVLVCSVQLEH